MKETPIESDMTSAFIQRQEAAIARGWTCTQCGKRFWVASDANDVYSGAGETELFAWWDILMDAKLYDEIGALLFDPQTGA